MLHPAIRVFPRAARGFSTSVAVTPPAAPAKSKNTFVSRLKAFSLGFTAASLGGFGLAYQQLQASAAEMMTEIEKVERRQAELEQKLNR
mmetsp:Transcript_35716/g.85961  ORF Transcript_35716/g.85961 Transcript_35716/m.85961 type:complete len:89 (+) Transcript_35716:67-333(+)